MLLGHGNIEMDTIADSSQILKNTHDTCIRHTCRTRHCFM